MIKTFDIVSEVVDEANKRFGPLWKLSERNLNILNQYCVALDTLYEHIDPSMIEAYIDEDDMTIQIKVRCPEIVIMTKHNLFYVITSRTVRMEFSHIDNENILLTFVFPSLWERV